VGSPQGTNDTANLDAADVLATDHGCENVNRSGGGDPGGGEPPTKAQCKKYGWTDYGTTYKNQGSCVSAK
jgi:hypothetical protein